MGESQEDNDLFFTCSLIEYIATAIEVLSSWIIKDIDNYNSSMYYENPSYIFQCYKEGVIL